MQIPFFNEPLHVVEIFADGSCIGNPGVGGWAYILRQGGTELVEWGQSDFTTNNQMELQAVIEGLSAVKSPSEVHIYSDSKYVLSGITEWMPKWKKKNWSKVMNVALWQRMDELVLGHRITTHHVSAHARHPEIDRACSAAKSISPATPGDISTHRKTCWNCGSVTSRN